MVFNAWYGKLLYIVIDSSYHRDLFMMFVLSRTVWAKNSLLITVVDEMFSLVYVFDIITIAKVFIYSAFFVRECMFLCSDKQSSVRFVDVRRITTRADEFINNIWLAQSNVVYEFICPGCNSVSTKAIRR